MSRNMGKILLLLESYWCIDVTWSSYGSQVQIGSQITYVKSMFSWKKWGKYTLCFDEF